MSKKSQWSATFHLAVLSLTSVWETNCTLISASIFWLPSTCYAPCQAPEPRFNKWETRSPSQELTINLQWIKEIHMKHRWFYKSFGNCWIKQNHQCWETHGGVSLEQRSGMAFQSCKMREERSKVALSVRGKWCSKASRTRCCLGHPAPH